MLLATVHGAPLRAARQQLAAVTMVATMVAATPARAAAALFLLQQLE